jgi:hypothetical protein
MMPRINRVSGLARRCNSISSFDGRRRDAHYAGDHQCFAVAPAQREPEHEPAPDVQADVDGAGQQQGPAAADEVVEGELDAEVEQQQDQPE